MNKSALDIDVYQDWLCHDRWNGYPLTLMLADSVDYFPALHSLAVINSGLCGEAGEASEHIKKWIRDQRLNRREAAIELGDVLAYLTWLGRALGYSIEEIAYLNYEKLRDRPATQAAGAQGKPEIV